MLKQSPVVDYACFIILLVVAIVFFRALGTQSVQVQDVLTPASIMGAAALLTLGLRNRNA